MARVGKITRQELSAGLKSELDAVNDKDTATLNAAKAYADQAELDALNAAKAYADQAEADAYEYANGVGSATLSSAQTYADDAISGKFLKGQLSTNNSSWVASGNATFPQKKGIAISGVVASDTPMIAFNVATIGIARDADIAYVECYAGGITLFAGKVPTGTVTFDYSIMKG